MPETPPGYREPYEHLTSDDHTAWIVIAATIGIIYSVIFLGFRIFIRRTLSLGRLSPDDSVVVAGTVRQRAPFNTTALLFLPPLTKGQVLAVMQSATVLAACNDGLGKRWSLLSSEMQRQVQQVWQ